MKNKTVEKNLKRIMFEKGFNQSELSRRMGLTRSVISGWFTGNRNPKRETLEKVSKILGVPVDSLFIDNEQKNFVENSGTIGSIGTNSGSINIADKLERLEEKDKLLEEKVKRLELEIELIKTKFEKSAKK